MTTYKEAHVRAQFERIARWARDHHYRTGKWLFVYLNKPSDDRFQVAIELKGRARGDGPIHTRQVAASKVGRVTFDPDVVSPRVIFFGITDWLRWERKEKTIRRTGSYREVYDGNPWTDRKVWSKTTLEVLVE
jgi:hypothetical protein